MASVSQVESGCTSRDSSFSSEPGSGPDDPGGRSRVSSKDARIQAILGVDSRRSLPPVSAVTLQRYYHFLGSRLPFPFRARHCPESDNADQAVTVTGLLDPREWDRGRAAGLLCAAKTAEGESIVLPLVEVEVRPGHSCFQLIEDYWYWFWNWRNQALARWAG